MGRMPCAASLKKGQPGGVGSGHPASKGSRFWGESGPTKQSSRELSQKGKLTLLAGFSVMNLSFRSL